MSRDAIPPRLVDSLSVRNHTRARVVVDTGVAHTQFVLLVSAAFAVLLACSLGLSLALRKRAESSVRRPRTLSELRRRAGTEGPRETGAGLLERDALTFVSISNLERRLDHRIEDADGVELGQSLQQPRPGRWTSDNGRPSRFSTVRVEIRDHRDAKIADLVRPAGVTVSPLSVLHADGAVAGTVAREGFRRFALRDASGARLGTIERRSWGYAVDYAVRDASGAQVATISDFTHIAKRLAGPVSSGKGRLRRLLGGGQPNEHTLEIVAPVTPELRMMMLGATAAVYLTLQRPFTDDG